MASVTVSPRGRLITFVAVPPSREADAATTGDADWTPLFRAAAIDPTALTAAEPRWTPNTYADRRVAWEGRYPGRPDWPMRIEAASFGGRPVWFTVMGPWSMASAPSGAPSSNLAATVQNNLEVALLVSLVVFSVWAARRNVRAGRADTRGASILAALTSVPIVLGFAIADHHAGAADVLWQRFIVQTGFALYWCAVIWLVYLAIEPEVRRRWPQALVSWARLLVGRVRDPLVARDLLVGCIGGVALVLAGDVPEALPEWLGQPGLAPTGGGLGGFSDTAGFISILLGRASRVVSESLLMLLLLLLPLMMLRNQWIAYVAMTVLLFGISFTLDALIVSAVTAALLVAIQVVLITRFGVLAYAAAWFVYYCVYDLPFSLDTSAWYFSRSAITAALIIGVAAWGAYSSTSGRPATRDSLLYSS
jgi:hypothetical protein